MGQGWLRVQALNAKVYRSFSGNDCTLAAVRSAKNRRAGGKAQLTIRDRDGISRTENRIDN